MHRNLILAGNFNMTNVKSLFKNLVEIGQHPKEYTDTITIMEKIGHFLDDAVSKLYKKLGSTSSSVRTIYKLKDNFIASCGIGKLP